MSHGVSIGIRTNDPSVLARTADAFPPGWEDSPSVTVDSWFSIVRVPSDDGQRVIYELYEDQEKLDEGLRLTRLLDSMDSAIRVAVGRRAPDRLFVHAGAVAWKGRAIVIPGRSGAGKTTLVAALVAAGATYYSDEYAVLDDRGFVHPYSRPLSIRQGEHRRMKQSATADLGGRTATGPLPVALVLATRFRSGATFEPRVSTPGHGAQAMFANTLSARERPAFAFSVLSRSVADATILVGDRGEAAAAVPVLLDHLNTLELSSRGSPA